MTRLDLDDLPPKIAAVLETLPPGEELVLVRQGVVVARLTAEGGTPAAESDADLPPQTRLREVFEDFRAAIEDEF